MERFTLACAVALLTATGAGAAPSDVAVLDLAGIEQAAPCDGDGLAPIAEADAIAASPGVSRQGLTLRVGKARFKSSPAPDDSEAALRYVFRGRYRAAPLALVDVVQYEQMSTLLVDPKSGAQVSTGRTPMPGPDGRTFAAVTRDDGSSETGDPTGGVEIVEWRAGKFTAVASETGDFCAVGWRGPDVLMLQAREHGGAWRPARMVRGAGGWTLTR